MIGALMYGLLWVSLRLCKLLWWRWEIEGLENLPPHGQGMILAVNHVHWSDIHILGASLPFSHRLSWLAKIELFHNPLAAWFFNQMQVIPIKRGRRDMVALNAAEDALARGAVLAIFPEGHRSRTGGLQEGRSGAVRLSYRTSSPIVPVAIWGTEQGLKGAALRRPIHVRIGRPYLPATPGAPLPRERMDALTDEMMLQIASMLPEQYWGFYRERMLKPVA